MYGPEDERFIVEGSEFQTHYRELFRSPTYIFYCAYQPETSAHCTLNVSDLQRSGLQELGHYVDYEQYSFKRSPDESKLLIIHEQEAIVIDLETLEEKNVYRVPESDYILGYITGYPSFVPDGEWLSDSTVQLSIYARNEPSDFSSSDLPEPVSVETINID